MLYLIEIILTENNSIHFDVYEFIGQWPTYLGTYRYNLNDHKMDEPFIQCSDNKKMVMGLIEEIYNIN